MLHVAPLSRDRWGRPITQIAVGGRCDNWLVDSGASLSIIHSNATPSHSNRTITIEGFDGTMSLASQSDNLTFEIGKDRFKDKAWLSATGHGRNVLGSDIMTSSAWLHYRLWQQLHLAQY